MARGMPKRGQDDALRSRRQDPIGPSLGDDLSATVTRLPPVGGLLGVEGLSVKKRTVAGLVAAVVLTVEPMSGAVAVSSPTIGSSAAGSGVLLARGTVLDAGQRPAAGARVTMVAWPSNDVLESMRVGDSFKLQVLSTAVTDARGGYALGATARDGVAPFADRFGNVNVDVFADSGSGAHSMQSTSLTPSPGTTTLAGARSVSGAVPPAAVSVPTMVLTARAATSPGQRAGALAHGMNKTCSSFYVGDLGNHTALVGSHYSTTTGVKHDFKYTSGATTTFGVGYSLSGKFGTFSKSGTHTRSSTAVVEFPAASGNRHDYTYFQWGKYHVTCADPGSIPTSSWYEARSRRFVGGSTIWNGPTAPSAGYCVTNAAGSRFVRTTSKAYEAGGGADVSAVLGIDLSARTGYSSAAEIAYSFSSTRRLCGTRDFPGGSPSRLVAKG